MQMCLQTFLIIGLMRAGRCWLSQIRINRSIINLQEFYCICTRRWETKGPNDGKMRRNGNDMIYYKVTSQQLPITTGTRKAAMQQPVFLLSFTSLSLSVASCFNMCFYYLLMAQSCSTVQCGVIEAAGNSYLERRLILFYFYVNHKKHKTSTLIFFSSHNSFRLWSFCWGDDI